MDAVATSLNLEKAEVEDAVLEGDTVSNVNVLKFPHLMIIDYFEVSTME